MFKEILRLLRPGGLFLYVDLESTLIEAGGTPIPYTILFRDTVHRGLHAQGVRPYDIPRVSTKLRAMGGFARVEHAVASIPLGPWDTSSALQQDIGARCARNLVGFSLSFQPLMRRVGLEQPEIDEIIGGLWREMEDPSKRIFLRYHTMYAFKAADAP